MQKLLKAIENTRNDLDTQAEKYYKCQENYDDIMQISVELDKLILLYFQHRQSDKKYQQLLNNS